MIRWWHIWMKYLIYDIFYCVFENSYPPSVIYVNRRRGIVSEWLLVNCRSCIDLWSEYSSLNYLRFEIERIFSIEKEMLQCENVWYKLNRPYDTAISLRIIAYNLMVISITESGKMGGRLCCSSAVKSWEAN